MNRFVRWLRVYRAPRVPCERAPAAASAPGADEDHDNDAVARLVIERLAEDEALRRNLTDDAFKPILDLVTSLVPAAAERASTQEDAAEHLSQSARQLVQGLSAAVASGDPSVVSAELLKRFMTEDQARDALQALSAGALPDSSPAERAGSLVATVKSALNRGRV